jgi:hypothetical protein
MPPTDKHWQNGHCHNDNTDPAKPLKQGTPDQNSWGCLFDFNKDG